MQQEMILNLDRTNDKEIERKVKTYKNVFTALIIMTSVGMLMLLAWESLGATKEESRFFLLMILSTFPISYGFTYLHEYSHKWMAKILGYTMKVRITPFWYLFTKKEQRAVASFLPGARIKSEHFIKIAATPFLVIQAILVPIIITLSVTGNFLVGLFVLLIYLDKTKGCYSDLKLIFEIKKLDEKVKSLIHLKDENYKIES